MRDTPQSLRSQARKAARHVRALKTLAHLARSNPSLVRALNGLDGDRLEEGLAVAGLSAATSHATKERDRLLRDAEAIDQWIAVAEALEAAGLCSHRSAMRAHNEPRYREQQQLLPGQLLCTHGCGTVFDTDEQWKRASHDPFADPRPVIEGNGLTRVDS